MKSTLFKFPDSRVVFSAFDVLKHIQQNLRGFMPGFRIYGKTKNVENSLRPESKNKPTIW